MTAPVSGHIKRVVVQEGLLIVLLRFFGKFADGVYVGDSIAQGDLTVEIVH